MISAKLNSSSFGTQEVKLQAFKAISAYLVSTFDFNQDPLLFANYRQIALADAGIDITGNATPFPLIQNAVTDAISQDRFIDAEFVAIYW